jgi:ketosteroid isomerase-like protein
VTCVDFPLKAVREGLGNAAGGLRLRLLGSLVLAIAALAGPGLADGIKGESAEEILSAWTEAVTSGDADRVASVLAPEFQLMRGDGTGYDKASYIAGGFPVIDAPPGIENIVETRDGDIRVMSYWLVLDAAVEGGKLTQHAPRLTVFRKIGGAWYVTAHANFALPGG